MWVVTNAVSLQVSTEEMDIRAGTFDRAAVIEHYSILSHQLYL